MHRLLLITLAGFLVVAGCRKRSSGKATDAGTATDQGAQSAALVAAPLADPTAVASPLPPPNAELTVAVERRFMPAQAMNAYAPAQPGDYQAQLNLFNRVLRKRAGDLGTTPATFDELMASSGFPKPPQPPAGRKLAYDPRTVTVSLQ